MTKAPGQRKSSRVGRKIFQTTLAIEPTNALATALLGSALTMRARDAFWPKTRLDYVKKGNKMMDAAVQLAPEDPDVRLVRANQQLLHAQIHGTR
jgi:hypothetical protein